MSNTENKSDLISAIDEQIEAKSKAREERLRKNTIQLEIASRKKKLRSTDYQAIKFSEGELSEAEYQPIKLQRREWRAEINLLEAELKEIKNSASE